MQESPSALIEKIAEGLTKWPFENWNFGDSVGFEALLIASKVTGNPRWEEFATAWFRSWATRAEPFARLDCTVPGKAMVEIAEKTKDPVLLGALTNLAGYLTARPQLNGIFETWETSPLLESYGPSPMEDWEHKLLANPPAGVFIDCLHFDPPFFTALGGLVGDDQLLTVGVDQALGYCSQLQTESGLFDHFFLRGVDGTFGPGWGRGQGWALLGLLDTIEQAVPHCHRLPNITPKVALLEDSVKKLIAAQIACQSDSGHWFAVVTDPNSGVESSTAAFMAHGFSRARKAGITDGPALEASTRRARNAVKESLNDDGMFKQVSAAVFACTAAEHYSHVPRNKLVPWGQGPALLALADQIIE